MADISKCTDGKCPFNDTCYRFNVIPDDFQYYADFKYDKGCEYFLKSNI